MLRATRRLLRPGGRTAFTAVHVTPGLGADDHRRAVEAGPWAVDTGGCSYPALLAEAGFGGIEATDVTAAYRATQASWLDEARVIHGELSASAPSRRLAERIAEQSVAREAVEEGLLGRALFVASRPPAGGSGAAVDGPRGRSDARR